MLQAYHVDMTPVFELDNPDHIDPATEEFKKAWPDASQIIWSNIYLLADDDQDCVSQIGDYFVDNFKKASPYPDKSQWVLDKPFSGGGWRIGSGGLHSGYASIGYKLNGVQKRMTLKYTYQSREYEGYVNVGASWKVITS